MCQQNDSGDDPEKAESASNHLYSEAARSQDPFPWDIGIFDAHCHPTDTLASLASIPHMKARALTVMSTRSEDQDLVSNLAAEQGVVDSTTLFSQQENSQRMIPSFGWHPWFSYQIFDDTAPDTAYDGSPESKIAHYDKILAPSPSLKNPSFIAGLQDPRPLSEFIQETRSRLEKYPFALVGEIGLDKAFRIPESWTSVDETRRDEDLTPGGREGRRLSPYRVNINHQTTVLKAQLRLAGEMNRAVSVHGVQAPGGVYNAISECWKGHEKEVLSRRENRRVAENAENVSDSDDDDDDAGKKAAVGKGKPFPPRICLHSYSGPVNVLTQYTLKSVPAKIFFSFSLAINWEAEGGEKNKKTEEVICACPDDRILVESDLHIAGDRMDRALEDICRKVCEVKGWELRKGVEQLARNWKEFIFDE
jgi:Tat protein secretion system quality control protein TatD with DNase activity